MKHVEQIDRLKQWIREEGLRTDQCTFAVLDEVCEGCRCSQLAIEQMQNKSAPMKNEFEEELQMSILKFSNRDEVHGLRLKLGIAILVAGCGWMTAAVLLWISHG